MTITANDIREYQSEVKANTPSFIDQHRDAFDSIIKTITHHIQQSITKDPDVRHCSFNLSTLITNFKDIDPFADEVRFRTILIDEMEALGFTLEVTAAPQSLDTVLFVSWKDNSPSDQDILSQRLDKIDTAIADLTKNIDLAGSEARIGAQLKKLNENVNDVKSEVKDNYYAIRGLDCY